MKKFLITLIYATLATMVMAYLFKAMHWTGFGEMGNGVLWLHIASYLLYSFMIKDRDPRIVYPMAALMLAIVVNILKIGSSNPMMVYAVYLVLVAYVAFHLLATDYLATSSLPVLRKISMGALVLFALAGIMKFMHVQYSNEMLIVGTGAVGFMLLFSGTTRGMEPRK
jgi:hypothetical protein